MRMRWCALPPIQATSAVTALPCSVFNNLEEHGDCQNTCKSYKNRSLWVGLWVGNPAPRPCLALTEAERPMPELMEW